jgi:hypothetical protein
MHLLGYLYEDGSRGFGIPDYYFEGLDSAM